MSDHYLHSVRVFSPASVANVSCGFDVLGFALKQPGDEIIARRSDTYGVTIGKISGEQGVLPKAVQKNTAGVAVQAMLDHLDLDLEFGIELEVHKQMPLGSGLGSSAASSVGAVFALNHLLDQPLDRKELLPFAAEGERVACGSAHLDNVAPSIMGGFVLIRSHEPPDIVSLKCAKPLYAAVVHPHIEIRTEDTRKILRKEVALSKAVTQWGNVGALVAGILEGDYDLISRSLHDEIIEPVRSMLIPGFQEVKEAALEAGVLGSGISGSGPSVFALASTEQIAKSAADEMQQAFIKAGLESDRYVSEITTGGPVILEEQGGGE